MKAVAANFMQSAQEVRKLWGVVSFVLGLLLWMQWPNSASWFIGFAVGLKFIFAGVAWSAFALKLKNA